MTALPLLRHCFLLIALLALTACQLAPRGPEPVHTSDGDTRDYRYLELPNRLRVLLISDPAIDKAAVALDVHVGSRQDPDDRPGLAHFLEHMLFLGTDRYPAAGDYQSFIAGHGGMHNAYTSFDHTNYFFAIDPTHLEPALDRFSRFFVAPLFTAEYVEREKNAVHSEYMATIRTDNRRALDALREAVNPQHPFSRFNVGSLTTLEDRPGRSVRDDLLAFYDRYYSANLMTLVVLGREPVAELERMVEGRFGAIPDRDRRVDPLAVPLFTPDRLPGLMQIQPVQQHRALSFAWPLPDLDADYRTKSLDYIANILGHEGQGSLLSALKQRGWALGLAAGQGFSYQGGGLFNVTVELTEAGLAHVDDITEALYQAIARIREDGVQDWLYREQQQVAEQRFRFRERPDAESEASRLAANLHDYPPAEVIRGDYLMERFEPGRVRELLGLLTPDTMLMTLSAPEAEADRRSTFYDTPYSLRPLAAERVERWRRAAPVAAIRLPDPNPFIAEPALRPLPASPAGRPALLLEREGLRLWFLQEPQFRVPRANVMIELFSPAAVGSPEAAVQGELLVRLLRENLNEFSYPASLAGLSFGISRSDRGLVLRTAGFDARQPLLLERLLDALREPAIDPEVFARVARDYRRRLADRAKQPPYQVLMANAGDVLYRDRWSDAEMAAAAEAATPAAVADFARRLLGQLEARMLVHGNFTEADARQLGEQVHARLLAGATPTPAPPLGILRLPADRELRLALPVPHDDASLLWYRQAADNAIATRAALGVSAQMIGSDFFNRLRTEQQLGYIVTSTPYPLRDVPGLVFLAQSPSASPARLAAAYRAFLEEWAGKDEATLAPLFEHHRAALVQRLAEAPKNLAEAGERLWSDTRAGHFGFDSRERILAAVRALEFPQWLALFQRDVLGDDGRALWLAAEGRFADEPLTRGEPVGELEAFKARQFFYPFP